MALRQSEKTVRLRARRHVGQTHTKLRADVRANRTTADQSAASARRNSQRAAAITNDVENQRCANQGTGETGNQQCGRRKGQDVVGRGLGVVKGASKELGNRSSRVGSRSQNDRGSRVRQIARLSRHVRRGKVGKTNNRI